MQTNTLVFAKKTHFLAHLKKKQYLCQPVSSYGAQCMSINN